MTSPMSNLTLQMPTRSPLIPLASPLSAGALPLTGVGPSHSESEPLPAHDRSRSPVPPRTPEHTLPLPTPLVLQDAAQAADIVINDDLNLSDDLSRIIDESHCRNNEAVIRHEEGILSERYASAVAELQSEYNARYVVELQVQERRTNEAKQQIREEADVWMQRMQEFQTEQGVEREQQMQIAMVASQAELESRYQAVEDIDYADVVAQVVASCNVEHEAQFEQAAFVQQQQMNNYEQNMNSQMAHEVVRHEQAMHERVAAIQDEANVQVLAPERTKVRVHKTHTTSINTNTVKQHSSLPSQRHTCSRPTNASKCMRFRLSSTLTDYTMSTMHCGMKQEVKKKNFELQG